MIFTNAFPWNSRKDDANDAKHYKNIVYDSTSQKALTIFRWIYLFLHPVLFSIYCLHFQATHAKDNSLWATAYALGWWNLILIFYPILAFLLNYMLGTIFSVQKRRSEKIKAAEGLLQAICRILKTITGCSRVRAIIFIYSKKKKKFFSLYQCNRAGMTEYNERQLKCFDAFHERKLVAADLTVTEKGQARDPDVVSIVATPVYNYVAYMDRDNANPIGVLMLDFDKKINECNLNGSDINTAMVDISLSISFHLTSKW